MAENVKEKGKLMEVLFMLAKIEQININSLFDKNQISLNGSPAPRDAMCSRGDKILLNLDDGRKFFTIF